MVEKNLTQVEIGEHLIPVEELVEVKAGATVYKTSRGIPLEEVIFHLALCGERDIVMRKPRENGKNGNGNKSHHGGDKWQEWRNMRA